MRKYLAGTTIVVVLLTTPATAEVVGTAPAAEGLILYLTKSTSCDESYADELRSVGLDIRIRQMGSLQAMSSFVGLPNGVEAKHILLAQGYVIADHVAPERVVEFLKSGSRASGLVGSSSCATNGDHTSLHRQGTKFF